MHFGSAFERYIQGLLRNMYPETGDTQRCLILNQELGSRRTQLGELDACLIDGKDLLLFEMKGKWIRETKLVEPNYEDYLDELRKKYGEAAQQLAEAVSHLVTDQAVIEGHNIRSTRRIYPILLAYDSSLSVPGNAWFFESEFREALHPDGLLSGSHRIMTKGQWEIAPFTLITVDLLEDLEASVKNFSLADLLRDYFAFRDATMQAEVDTLALREFIDLSDYAEMIDTYGKHQVVIAELRRALKKGGIAVHESMNWAWEYRSYPSSGVSFTRSDMDGFIFRRTRRTTSGSETTRDYEVRPGTPLYRWLLEQKWPMSSQEWNTSLDVEEETPIPKEWLKFRGVGQYKHYRSEDLKRLYRTAGFRHPKVLAYGQTYDIAAKAGLLQQIGPFQSELAAAEAELAFTLRLGSGPWLFLIAEK